jgi:hypothetical protein
VSFVKTITDVPSEKKKWRYAALRREERDMMVESQNSGPRRDSHY